MCDYSLEMYASRPAVKEEKYVTTRFPSGSIGLAVPGDCTTAVCVLPGAKLNLENISADVQAKHGIPAEGVVQFVRLEHGAYRDGIKFDNGKEISLQQLGVGVSLYLPLAPKAEIDPGYKASATVHVTERVLEPAE